MLEKKLQTLHINLRKFRPLAAWFSLESQVVWGEGLVKIRDWDEPKVQCTLLAHIYCFFCAHVLPR